jgi:hypothetical protein
VKAAQNSWIATLRLEGNLAATWLRSSTFRLIKRGIRYRAGNEAWMNVHGERETTIAAIKNVPERFAPYISKGTR